MARRGLDPVTLIAIGGALYLVARSSAQRGEAAAPVVGGRPVITVPRDQRPPPALAAPAWWETSPGGVQIEAGAAIAPSIAAAPGILGGIVGSIGEAIGGLFGGVQPRSSPLDWPVFPTNPIDPGSPESGGAWGYY